MEKYFLQKLLRLTKRNDSSRLQIINCNGKISVSYNAEILTGNEGNTQTTSSVNVVEKSTEKVSTGRKKKRVIQSPSNRLKTGFRRLLRISTDIFDGVSLAYPEQGEGQSRETDAQPTPPPPPPPPPPRGSSLPERNQYMMEDGALPQQLVYRGNNQSPYMMQPTQIPGRQVRVGNLGWVNLDSPGVRMITEQPRIFASTDPRLMNVYYTVPGMDHMGV